MNAFRGLVHALWMETACILALGGFFGVVIWLIDWSSVA